MKKTPILLILVAAIAMACGAYFYQMRHIVLPQPTLNTGSLYPAPRDLDAFSLTIEGQASLSDKQLKDHYSLLFFGFTRCPDICPLTLAALAEAYKAWPSALAERKPKVWFISVDPERDALKPSSDYAKFFNPEFQAATGTITELQALARQLNVAIKKVPDDNSADNYSIDHSANLLLINPKGQLVGVIRPPFVASALRDDLLAMVSD